MVSRQVIKRFGHWVWTFDGSPVYGGVKDHFHEVVFDGSGKEIETGELLDHTHTGIDGLDEQNSSTNSGHYHKLRADKIVDTIHTRYEDANDFPNVTSFINPFLEPAGTTGVSKESAPSLHTHTARFSGNSFSDLTAFIVGTHVHSLSDLPVLLTLENSGIFLNHYHVFDSRVVVDSSIDYSLESVKIVYVDFLYFKETRASEVEYVQEPDDFDYVQLGGKTTGVYTSASFGRLFGARDQDETLDFLVYLEGRQPQVGYLNIYSREFTEEITKIHTHDVKVYFDTSITDSPCSVSLNHEHIVANSPNATEAVPLALTANHIHSYASRGLTDSDVELIISKTVLPLIESETFTFKLNALPAEDVTVNLDLGTVPSIEISLSSVTIAVANWDVENEITITAIEGSDTFGSTIVLTTTSTRCYL